MSDPIKPLRPINNGDIEQGDVLVSQLRLDGGTQMRVDAKNADVADEYAEALRDNAAALPPIEVVWDGEFYWLVDGFHRVYAAQSIGLATLPAIVRRGSLVDAQVRALSVNQTHGLRRTNPDKRRAVLQAMTLNEQHGKGWGSRAIADICGVGRRFAQKVIDQQEQDTPLNSVAHGAPHTTGGSPAAAAPEEGFDEFDGELTHEPIDDDGNPIPEPTEPTSQPKRTQQTTPTRRATPADLSGRDDNVLRDVVGQPVRQDKPHLVRAFTAELSMWREVKSRADSIKLGIQSKERDTKKLLEDYAAALESGTLSVKHDSRAAHLAETASQLHHCAAVLRSAMQDSFDVPFCVCPVCGGEGCDQCKKRGWLTKHGFEMLTEQFQRLVYERADRADEYVSRKQASA